MNVLIPYEPLVEVLARHLQDHWLFDTAVAGQPAFSHDFMSQKQIAAAVLEALRILEPCSPGSSCFVFTCDSQDFKSRALEYRSAGYDYEVVILAFLGMADHGMKDDDLVDCVVKLKLYERGPRDTLLAGENFTRYKEIYRNWPSLLNR